MPDPIEIYLPCDVYTVRVALGPQQALSKLERLFLEALLNELSHFQELSALFGLGQRPTLDLVFDLWQRGYVILDLAQGGVYPGPHIDFSSLDKLESAERSDETRNVMLDKVTGTVMPVSGQRHTPVPRTIVPADLFDVSMQNVAPAALLGTLRKIVEKPDTTERPRRVLAAHLSLAELSPAPQRRWRQVLVMCTRDTGADSLHFSLPAGQEISAPMQSELVTRLGRIVESRPDSSFVKYLGESAQSGEPEVRSAEDLLARLEKKIAGLALVEPSLQEQHQDDLVDLADEIEYRRRERERARVEAQFLSSQSSQMDVLVDLVRGASRQLVLTCPWIQEKGLVALLPELESALTRGVQVYVLWGFDPRDELDDRVNNAFLPFLRKYPRLFFVAPQSCRTHTKLVLQDDRAALISTLNFLSPSEPDTLEIGVLLRTLQDEAPCATVEALLAYAREIYPDYLAARGIYASREEFRLSESGTAEDVVESAVPRPVAPINGSGGANGTTAGHAATAARIWESSWTEYAAWCRRDILAQQLTARVLRDGEHREVLWNALRHAKHRLLITSDRLGGEVVDDRFLAEIRSRLKVGVKVTLLHRRWTSRVAEENAALEKRLNEFMEEYPDHFEHHLDDNHSKLLVCDDYVVISSFNFLSYYGYYVEIRPSVRRRQRDEVGVLLRGVDRAEASLDLVRDFFPSVCASWARSSATEEDDPVTVPPLPVSGRELQESLCALAERPDPVDAAGHIRALVTGASDSWRLLETLEAAGLPESDLTVAVASALTREDLAAPSTRWHQWLAEASWSQRRFVEAAVLCANGFGAESERLPRLPIIMLAAARETRGVANALIELSLQDDLSDTERVVLAGTALVEWAIKGTMDAADIVREQTPCLPKPLQHVIGAFEDYWEVAYERLPMEAIRGRLQNKECERELDSAWAELERCLEEGATTHFKFESGTKTRERLFHENGVFGRLQTVAQKRQPDGIESWLKTDHLDDLDTVLDNATAEAEEECRYVRKGPKRRAYLKTLASIVEAARRISELAEFVSGADSPRLVAAQHFAKKLSAYWPALEPEGLHLEGPECPVLELALRDIREIVEWGAN